MYSTSTHSCCACFFTSKDMSIRPDPIRDLWETRLSISFGYVITRCLSLSLFSSSLHTHTHTHTQQSQGMELYPRVFDFDLKLFTNCRFGLMAWTILPISYCYKQMDLYGEVSPALLSSTVIQLVYMYKFYLWEMGYMHTMDIQHDRFGYYEGWGCSVWVPIIYTSHSLYVNMIHSLGNLSNSVATDPVIFIFS